eukprot:scaffold31092_cov55-Phaeocystis_antarctica.AAC.4
MTWVCEDRKGHRERQFWNLPPRIGRRCRGDRLAARRIGWRRCGARWAGSGLPLPFGAETPLPLPLAQQPALGAGGWCGRGVGMVLGLTFVLRWAATGDARVARDDGCESVERNGGAGAHPV